MIKYFSILILLLGVISYFLGWMYLYYYLDFFGIYIFEVDIPVYYFFIYSFALLDNINFFNATELVIAAGITIIYVILRNIILQNSSHMVNLQYHIKLVLKTSRIDTQIILKTWQALALVSLLFLGHNYARTVAYAEAANIRDNSEGALILLKDTVKSTIKKNFSDDSWFLVHKFLIPETTDAPLVFRSILVFSTKNRYFLLLRYKKSNLEVPLITISLSKSDVIFIGSRPVIYSVDG